MRETDTHIYFWGSIFSNWEPCKIIYDNLLFKSSEHLFMWLKAMYFSDIKTANLILKTNSPSEAKRLGRLINDFDEILWEKKREDVMYIACFEKFNQNQDLKNTLLQTKDKILVEASPYDCCYGIGLKWDDDLVLDEKNWLGLNLLGKILMKIRNDLRK
jgi:ribA/ribD-fused uncharacterized protein